MTLQLPSDDKSWQDLKKEFDTKGFLVFEGYWDNDVCQGLRRRMAELIDGFDLQAHKSVFSTNEQSRTSDDYFLGSGDKIRFFWEENAFDPKTGEFLQPRAASINKVGHALHDLDPVFEDVTYTKQIGRIARKIGGLEVPLAAQSMYIFKQPRIGGEVGAHQDGTFLYTEPQSVVGFWWALEDCTQGNGCLWAIPGSHTQGVKRRFKRRISVGKDRKGREGEGEATDSSTSSPSVDSNNRSVDSNSRSVDNEGSSDSGSISSSSSGGTEFSPAGPPPTWDLTKAIPLEVPKGSLVLLHHALVHFSLENRSTDSRHAYSVHVVEGAKGTLYPGDNWLQRDDPNLPFRQLP